MPEAPRITVDELRRRMQASENFTFLDVRNPKAWMESADMAAGAIRVTLDDFEEYLPRIPQDQNIVTYCT